MHIENDICYAGTRQNVIRVAEVKPLDSGMMIVLFTSGELRLFDATQLEGSAFDALKNPAVFDAPRVEDGFVSWADGTVDLAPEYMYEHSVTCTRDDDALLAG